MTPCPSCGQPQCGYIIDAEWRENQHTGPRAAAALIPGPAPVAIEPPFTRRELVTEALRNVMHVRANCMIVGWAVFAACAIILGHGHLWMNVTMIIIATVSLAVSFRREYRLSRVVGQIRHQI